MLTKPPLVGAFSVIVQLHRLIVDSSRAEAEGWGMFTNSLLGSAGEQGTVDSVNNVIEIPTRA